MDVDVFRGQQRAKPLHRHHLLVPLWLSVLACALPSLLYQNSGYIQFGYRFSLDYMVFLIMLLALGGRRINMLFKSMVLVAVAVNTFGAVVFDRYRDFFYDDPIFPHGNH